MDRMSRLLGTGLAMAVVVGMTPPAAAFFDFFGAQSQSRPQPQPQPYYYGRPAPSGGWGRSYAHYGRHKIHHAVEATEEKMPRQTTTDLMHDATLRYGDAVMTKSGIKIFTGARQASHDRDDFSSLAEAHVKSSQKIALDAIDASRPGHVAQAKVSNELRTGRSSASTVPLSKGVMISAANGKSIRYVGP